ncbi:HK97 family phage major capsid protein [Rhodoblastus acidophilus]|uniref:phage major capsid protein n=1 Tax=Rhodoblastus acidophilus TaxID=1074 RepID=UPI002224164C|nr:phage major capsid protein [Rhodoblastus acidophilus]MCW2315306.1 HK97 family phage major capsid protein [Rhodoblastus acidophilus]
MSKSIQALREQRAAKAAEVKNLLDPAVTSYTKEVQAKVEGVYAEIDLIDAQIEQINRAVGLSADGEIEANARMVSDSEGRSVDENSHRVIQARKAFSKALALGTTALTPEEAVLCSADDPRNRGRVLNVAEGASATGGVLVPTIVMPYVLSRLLAFGGMRAVAQILATAGGQPFQWGTIDDTSAEGEIVAEGIVASDDDLAFGSTTVGAYKFSSKTIPISMEMLQDSAVNVETVVLNALATRIARGQNRYFTTGTGAGQPQGVVTAVTNLTTAATGNTASIAFDNLVDLYESVDVAYQEDPSFAFMMHQNTRKVLRKVKDSQGRPILLPTTEKATVDSAPNSGFEIFGKPVVINNHMASPVASAVTILAGAFNRYLIRDVMDVLILRFTDSAYAKKGQVGFLGWARADGRMIDAKNSATSKYESIKGFQQSAT